MLLGRCTWELVEGDDITDLQSVRRRDKIGLGMMIRFSSVFLLSL